MFLPKILTLVRYINQCLSYQLYNQIYSLSNNQNLMNQTTVFSLTNQSETTVNNSKAYPFLLTRNPKSKFLRYRPTHDWSDEETHKSAIFIIQFQKQLKQNDKKLTVFLLHALSQFVFSRNFNQCRLYYQSIIKTGIQSYIQQMKRRYPFIQKQRHDYGILMDCIRSNCILNQNCLKIDYMRQNMNTNTKNNFLGQLYGQSNSVNESKPTLYEQFSEQFYYRPQSYHQVNKKRSLSMQQFLKQQQSEITPQYSGNIYRNVYKFAF